MIRGLSDHTPALEGRAASNMRPRDAARPQLDDAEVGEAFRDGVERRASPRRTPRISVVVVLPENHAVSPASLTSLSKLGDQEVDVVVACAGQPADLNALQRTVRGAQFILAPAGTSAEDLRELAMRQAPGDIVTLLSGALLTETDVTRQQLFRSS
jgi:hypothetical protein